MIEEKYSVLMSVYDKENPNYFYESINSMINQSLFPNQIVIVKDGQLTDKLDDIIKKFVLKYPNTFTIVTLKKNLGLGLALNEGLKKCRNELVARMDTDDISVENRCELQVEKFQMDEKLSIVGTIINEFYDDPHKIVASRVVPLKHKEILKFSRRRNPFNHVSVMYKKSEVLALGGYGDFRRNQDLDLFVRMLNSNLKSLNINKGLVLVRANKYNLKKRKSWLKSSSYISMIYKFWKKGYSSFIDFLIVTITQTIVFLSPLWLLEWITNTFLRKSNNREKS